MYRIIRDDGVELGITDSVLFITIADNGCFVPTTEENAIGVAFKSVAYNLVGHTEISGAETVLVAHSDVGDVIAEMATYAEMAAAIREGVNAV